MQWIAKFLASFRAWLSANEDAHANDVADVTPAEGKGPVCGMTVQPDSPQQTTHDNRVIRFCGAKCLAKFDAEPQRYLHPASEPAPVRSAAWRWSR